MTGAVVEPSVRLVPSGAPGGRAYPTTTATESFRTPPLPDPVSLESACYRTSGRRTRRRQHRTPRPAREPDPCVRPRPGPRPSRRPTSRNVTRWEGWIRRHIRSCFWQRWHDWRGRQRKLRTLGVRGRGLRVASSSKGTWRIAVSPVVQQALSNAVLRCYGFWVPSDLALT